VRVGAGAYLASLAERRGVDHEAVERVEERPRSWWALRRGRAPSGCQGDRIYCTAAREAASCGGRVNLDKFLNLMATIFGALGSIYVMAAIIGMSPELMERQTQSQWDFSVSQMEALASQKGDNAAGFVFVVIAFVLAAGTLAFVPEGVRVFQKRGVALALAAILSGGVYVTLHFLSQGISRHQKFAMARITTLRALDELVRRHKVETWDASSFRVYADLLDIEAPPGEPARSLLERIAARAGRVLPSDLDYSAVEPKN
jgi:hypothetical protein